MSTDEELIERCAARDAEAFAALYDRYAPRAYGLVRQIVPPHAADDVLQDAFIVVWQRAETYDAERAAAAAWILMIVRSRAIDFMRRRLRTDRAAVGRNGTAHHAPEFEETALGVASPASRNDATAASIDLPDLLRALTAEHRELLSFSFFRGMSHRQIATLTDIPVGTVKTRIRAAIHEVRDLVLHRSPDDAPPMRREKTSP